MQHLLQMRQMRLLRLNPSFDLNLGLSIGLLPRLICIYPTTLLRETAAKLHAAID
jgi:hypothetical protein